MGKSRTAIVARAVILTIVLALPLSAQSRVGDGYLLHSPQGRFSVRGGYALATAGSDVFDDAVRNLTLDRRDFSGFTIGAELAFVASPRFDVGIDVGYSRSNKGSEFRNFIDNDDQPIQQATKFERVPIMVNARAYLSNPGRSVGKLAWIPAQFAPWVGVGGGLMWYRFNQVGDFVDFENNNVFFDTIESSGTSLAAQGMAGVDVTITPRMAITGDARYVWAKGNLQPDFSGFDRIDLSGASLTLGLTFRM